MEKQVNKFFIEALQFANIGKEHVWILEVFLIIFLALLASFIITKLLRRVQARLEKTPLMWDDLIVRSLNPSIRLWIWLVAVEMIASKMDMSKSVTKNLDTILFVGGVFAFTWAILRLIRFMSERYVNEPQYQKKALDKTTAGAIAHILKLSVFITAGLTCLETFGVSIEGLLAFGGFGGIAVGFAAKDLLSNFFGALMIYFDRPFEIGDWIKSPDRNIEGTVENIGWRQTIIRTFDKRPLYVPNGLFSTIVVENPSRMTNRRIKETISLRYDDIGKMSIICTEVEAMLRSHAGIDIYKTLMVNFNKFNSSSIDFFIYTFTKTTNWEEFHAVKHDVLLKVADIISKHGAEIAFPTRNLNIINEIEAKRG
jgi:MscS family membrane protein